MIALAPVREPAPANALFAVVELLDATIEASRSVQSDDLRVGFALQELIAVRQALVAAEGRS